ncbi:MAG TPA: caspase family protein [Vicinamibacterales bacterium]
MSRRPGRRVVLIAAVCAALVCAGAPSTAQTRFHTKVVLGANDELEIDAVYHDPADIDRRLGGTRVIPMELTVRNRSGRPVPLDYRDLILDLGGSNGLTRLLPIDPATARSTLMSEGHYNDFIRFVAGQTDRFSNIDPFSRILGSGPIQAGKEKGGYVFFMRPPAVPFTSFLALGMINAAPKILPTNDFQVMSPDKEATSLWRDSFRGFERWANSSGVARSIREIVQGPPPFRASYALLMGVSNYRRMDPLPRVKDDLDRLTNVLRALGFTVVRVENEKLTPANVRSPQAYFENISITPDDRLLVFFAGHGFRRTEAGKPRGYLALIDARNGEASSDTTIAMEEFVAWTQRVPAKHLLVLLESCFSGLAVGGRDVQMMGGGAAATGSTPDPVALYQLSKDPGRYLLMAGDENQRVPMGEKWGGGLFANAIIQGLQGRADVDKDGFVTARELYPWVRTYVSAEAQAVLGTSVTPLFKDLDRVVSKGEFVFTRAK